ncbi:MAG: BCCT family transporter [Pseudomonadota bacterium]
MSTSFFDPSYTIPTEPAGFLQGYNRPVTVWALICVAALIVLLLLWPAAAAETLIDTRTTLLSTFRGWYMYIMLAFFLLAGTFALLPGAGEIRLSRAGERPEFSTFSWLSMMFCAGIGAAIVVFSVSEPLTHLSTNPDILGGKVAADTAEAASSALKYTFLHWGLSAWACYAVLGLAIAYFSYRHGTPLTVRSALTPLLGHRFGGLIGHGIDFFSVFAIIAGLAVSMGNGVPQFVAGLSTVFKLTEGGTVAVLIALAAVAALSSLAIISGVKRGIKWMSNTSTLIFLGVLALFIVFGSTRFATDALVAAVSDYVSTFLGMSTVVATPDGTVPGETLANWQVDWTIFYWAWWIGFAPFVGMFLARVSKGRSIREFVLGTMLGPCAMCMVWFAYVGGTAISIELADTGTLSTIDRPAQLYATLMMLLGDTGGVIVGGFVCALVFMLLASVFIAGILAINTIAAGGDDGPKPAAHVLLWSVSVTLIIAGLILAGGIASIRDAVIISALPFSIIIALAGFAMVFMLVAHRTTLVKITEVPA